MSENIEKTEKDYIKEQIVLAKQIVLKNTINLNQVRTVAGIDLAYWKKNETEYAVCCIVIIDYHTLEIIEEVCYKEYHYSSIYTWLFGISGGPIF